MKLGPCLLALACATFVTRAATTAAWEMNTYQDFLKGRFSGVSLSRQGRLVLAPKLETLFSSDQPAIWSVVQASNGTLYLGTGHRGRVYSIDPAGKSSVLWTADQPEVFALALDPKGVLYAATSPGGRIYRIENGKASEYFNPNATYIWSLAFAPDGTLYAGTGDEGKIYRIEGPGKGEVYYETGQSHVTCLAFDSEGRLLAGTEPNGILYRVGAKDKAFVLYDAELPEIRAVIPTPDGAIYAAALGGSLAKRIGAGAGAATAPAGQVSVSAPATSITVTDESTQGGVEIKPKAEAPKPAAAAPAEVAPIPVIETFGVEKSALIKIHADHTVETLWKSNEENVYDLLTTEGSIWFSTDQQGRIYRLDPDRKLTLLVQTNESETIRLLPTGAGLLAATSNMGKVFRLGKGYAPTGSYEAPIHDAGSVARWGRLSWRVDAAAGTRVTLQTRSGNSARADRTWSDWSESLTDPDGSPIRSPNARYIQWRAEFQGAEGSSPALDSVTLAYLPQNTPPKVNNITVTAVAAQPSAAKPAPQAAPAAAYSITVTDTGEAGASTHSGTPTQALSRTANQQMQISWQAEDADGDRLVYNLYFRGDDESEWKLLKSNLEETSFSLDSDILADGRYFFRVTASDRLANPPNTAREAELVSSPVRIDQTPPIVVAGSPRRSGSSVEIDVEARDATSPLRRCEYSLNARPWVPLEASDGVTDSREERFAVRLDNLPPGEHLLVIRVYDSAGNAGLTKVVLR